MKSKMVRRIATVGAVLAMTATAAATANAVVLDPPGRQGSLVSFGPLMDNGFPTSYKDSHAVRLEACITADDPLCAAAAGPTYNPDLPLSFPTNFPDEFFYQLASAVVSPNQANPTEKLLVETNLEGAFLNGNPAPGDQMVFARVRIKDVDVPNGTVWRITHPYGVDEITAGENGKAGINVTADVGAVAGNFSAALAGRVGPFLKWDPAVDPQAPAGYVGDPGVLHKVVGSPYDTNYIKVEQKNPDGSYTLVGQWDDQFSLQGRLAVNSGVDVDAAYFSGNDSGGFLDVYASSDAGQSIVVSANAAMGTPSTPMRELDGRYYARIAVNQKIPAGTQIEVVNTGDKPVAKKLFTIQDQVTITGATYNADTQGLTVQATTSDLESGADAPTLTAVGFGSTLPVPLINGQATFPNVAAPPPVVKVTSSAGGSDTSTLTTSGAGFGALAPVAAFVAPLTAQVGQPVALDGTTSVGNITSYAWTTNNGTVTPNAGNPALATWTPSTVDPAATVTLTVTGPGGTNAVTNTVNVTPAVVTTANAGPDQVKTRGQVVTLAGTASGQSSVLWSQVSGPPVTLSSTTSLTPTFTYPKMALPVGPAGHVNPGYAVNNAPVVLQLTATPNGGGALVNDTVTISPTPETITPGTIRYRTNNGDWRVSGTTDLRAGQVIAMVLGSNPATGQFIGQATVDAAGAFSFRGGPQPVAAGSTVTFVSQTGGFNPNGPLLITK
jgi:hypothetical protein